MVGVRKLVTGIASEVAETVTKEGTQQGLSRSGRNVSKDLIEQILDFKNLPDRPKQLFESNPIPVQDYPAIKQLYESEDIRFADYKDAVRKAETPKMIAIADEVNNELLESSQKAKVQSQIDELRGLRTEGEHQFGLRSGQDKGLSAMSTGPELISGDKRIYQLSTNLRKPYQELEETISANPYAKEFHHKFNKAVSSPYFERAWELVDSGLASEEDIIALHRYALDKSVPSGDRQSAIMMFERIPHNEFHEFIRSIGLEPRSSKFEKTGVTSKYSKTPGRKLRSKPSTDSPLKMEQSRIKKLETMEDLAADFKQTVDETIVPMNREDELLSH